MAVNSSLRPSFSQDLSGAERQLLSVLERLGFGRLESVRIRGGQPLVDPWPTVVQYVKFGTTESPPRVPASDFELKGSIAEFFQYIRGVGEGEIRRLEFRHGLPFSIEVEQRISREVPDVKGEHVEAV
jgi:hypothetical protein